MTVVSQKLVQRAKRGGKYGNAKGDQPKSIGHSHSAIFGVKLKKGTRTVPTRA